jgi:shikimate dehydrogenase
VAYDAVEVRPDGLARLLDGLGPEWLGLSLTMPLKQSVLPLLDSVSPLALATGAANTVVLGAEGRAGDNTDVHGIVAALAEAGVDRVERSVVVGAGATAASALAALAALGDPAPVVLVREPARAGALREAAGRLGVDPVVERLTPQALVEAQVVVSTVPAGALDALAGELPPCSGVLLDVVYDPWPTALARAWQGPVVGGAVMLLHQAARQVELMTGHPAPLPQMRAALAPSLLSSPRGSRPK